MHFRSSLWPGDRAERGLVDQASPMSPGGKLGPGDNGTGKWPCSPGVRTTLGFPARWTGTRWTHSLGQETLGVLQAGGGGLILGFHLVTLSCR